MVNLLKLFFDREPGVIAIAAALQENLGIRLEPKAAGQHIGVAERYIRLLKDHCRATKMGVLDKYGYVPPTSWNLDLVLDVNSCLNGLVKVGKEVSPYELFTGKPPDRLRGVRGLPWGSIVLTKPPKTAEASKINTPKADYSVVVRRMRDKAGVIKVYQIETGKFAYRLQVKKVADIPEWVLNKLNAIKPDASIGYEDESFADDVLIDPEPEADADITDDEMRIVEGNVSGTYARDEVDGIIERILEEPEFSPGYGIISNDVDVDQPSPTNDMGTELQPTIGETDLQRADNRRYPTRDRHPSIRYPASETYFTYAMSYSMRKLNARDLKRPSRPWILSWIIGTATRDGNLSTIRS